MPTCKLGQLPSLQTSNKLVLGDKDECAMSNVATRGIDYYGIIRY